MRGAVLIAICLLFTGCVVLPATKPPVMQNNIAPPALLSPASYGGELHLKQRIKAQFAEQQRGFNAILRITPARLELLALGPLGRPLLTAQWDGSQLLARHMDERAEAIQAAQILADIQAALWPCEVLLLGGYSGVCGDHRLLSYDQQPHYKIYYEGAVIFLHNQRFGYRLEIRSQPID